MSSIFLKIGSVCALGLIFLSQILPTAYTEIKAVLLVIGGTAVGLSLIHRQLTLQRWQLIGVLLLATGGLLYSVYGYMRGNPGAIRVLSVWFIWPLIYLAFSSLLKQPNAYVWLNRIFITSLVAVVVYSFLYLGHAAKIIPDRLYIRLDQGQAVGFYNGFVEYNLYSISSLLFLIPYYTHFLLEQYKISTKVKWGALLLLLSAFILAILTGRRAMLLALLLLPPVIFFSNKLLKNRRKLKIKPSAIFTIAICLLCLTLLGGTLGLQHEAIITMFLDGFDFSSSDSSASERTVQFHALIEGWLDTSVLFGAGNGAAVAISRSEEQPWAYELTYVYLLFSTGLIGVLFFFGWYAWGLKRLRSAMQKRPDLILYAAPMLTASLIFCIAAATNPYLGKFDYLWVVLLPFLIAGWTQYQSPNIQK